MNLQTPTPPKPEASKTPEEIYSEEITGKSTTDSMLRIARALRNSGGWGYPALNEAAKAFEREAKFLSPGHDVIATKEDLEKQIEASRAAIGKAEAVLANPNAKPHEQTDALKDLQKHTVPAK